MTYRLGILFPFHSDANIESKIQKHTGGCYKGHNQWGHSHTQCIYVVDVASPVRPCRVFVGGADIQVDVELCHRLKLCVEGIDFSFFH